MRKTAIILAGGSSERFGQEKGLVEFSGKPLILRVIERIEGVAEEIIVVVRSEDQKRLYSPILGSRIEIFLDMGAPGGPLTGALTGFSNAAGEYSLLLPCDTPFISKDVIDLMFEISSNVDAVIPRWPNGYIEPLQAVYKTNSALVAGMNAVRRGDVRLQAMVSLLRRVRYLYARYKRY